MVNHPPNTQPRPAAVRFFLRQGSHAPPPMKTIGLLGGLHPTKIVLYSVDFAEIETLQQRGDWESAGVLLAQAARKLQHAGAAFIVLCTNTMHKVAPAIEALVPIPLLHIADPTAAAIRSADLSRVGLLGTRFTMEQDFYRARLMEQHGIDVLIPDADDRALVHRVIYEELCLGRIEEASRRAYRDIMQRLIACGAQGIILGCTEISLLVRPEDASVPLFDTTALHAQATAMQALATDQADARAPHASRSG